MKIKIYVNFFLIISTHINKNITINYLHNEKVSITNKKTLLYLNSEVLSQYNH